MSPGRGKGVAERGKLPTFPIAWCIATLFGVGRVPVAPGTAGSAVGVALYWVLYQRGWYWPVVIAPLLIAVAVWSSGAVERDAGRKDPQEVIVDELAGQILCLLAVPPTPSRLAAGFVLFRVFDIAKPLRRLESLPGGWGIVADDLLAGALGWGSLAVARGAGLL